MADHASNNCRGRQYTFWQLCRVPNTQYLSCHYPVILGTTGRLASEPMKKPRDLVKLSPVTVTQSWRPWLGPAACRILAVMVYGLCVRQYTLSLMTIPYKETEREKTMQRRLTSKANRELAGTRDLLSGAYVRRSPLGLLVAL